VLRQQTATITFRSRIGGCVRHREKTSSFHRVIFRLLGTKSASRFQSIIKIAAKPIVFKAKYAVGGIRT
jgi:hypothetical protein